MTDAELTAAVAEQLGWIGTKESSQRPGVFFGFPPIHGPAGGVTREVPPWLTSVDAALGVLDKGEHYSIDYDGVIISHKFTYRNVQTYDSSLPRAILLAFLEALQQEEKP